MDDVAVVGVAHAKSVIQVHGVDTQKQSTLASITWRERRSTRATNKIGHRLTLTALHGNASAWQMRRPHSGPGEAAF